MSYRAAAGMHMAASCTAAPLPTPHTAHSCVRYATSFHTPLESLRLVCLMLLPRFSTFAFSRMELTDEYPTYATTMRVLNTKSDVVLAMLLGPSHYGISLNTGFVCLGGTTLAAYGGTGIKDDWAHGGIQRMTADATQLPLQWSEPELAVSAGTNITGCIDEFAPRGTDVRRWQQPHQCANGPDSLPPPSHAPSGVQGLHPRSVIPHHPSLSPAHTSL